MTPPAHQQNDSIIQTLTRKMQLKVEPGKPDRSTLTFLDLSGNNFFFPSETLVLVLWYIYIFHYIMKAVIHFCFLETFNKKQELYFFKGIFSILEIITLFFYCESLIWWRINRHPNIEATLHSRIGIYLVMMSYFLLRY